MFKASPEWQQNEKEAYPPPKPEEKKKKLRRIKVVDTPAARNRRCQSLMQRRFRI